MPELVSALGGSGRSLGRTLLRPVHFPSPPRCLVELAMLAAVFLVAGHVSLGHGVGEMLGPMIPVVLVMVLCSVASGVYRPEITGSVIALYVHSIYGFVAAATLFVAFVSALAPVYASPRFVFFFLFLAFFVTHTVRPLLSGTDGSGGAPRGEG